MIAHLFISLLLFQSGEPLAKAGSTSIQTTMAVGKLPFQPTRQDTTFTLKIENDKRVVDNALKARLTKEIKTAIAANHLTKPYQLAMGFTRGARDVETFLFGEQIFYSLAESGFTIKGKPLDLPDVAPSPIPQIRVIDKVIYVVLSKM